MAAIAVVGTPAINITILELGLLVCKVSSVSFFGASCFQRTYPPGQRFTPLKYFDFDFEVSEL
jgi:hypothetical protein